MPSPRFSRRIARTLQAGHRVWLVGDMAWVGPGEKPLVLPPAPLPQTGFQEGPYTYSWSSQTAYFLQSHAAQLQVIPPLVSGRVNPFENPPLTVVEGWH